MNKEQRQAEAEWVALRKRFRLIGILLMASAFLLMAIVVALTIPPTYALDTSKIGIHMLLDDGRNAWDEALWQSHFTYADAVSAPQGLVVQVIRADDLNPARWQTFLDLSEQSNLTPVLRLATTFDREQGYWSIPEADEAGSYRAWGQQYADFLNALIWYQPQKMVILLNEPNNGHDWGGRPDAVAYARFVVDVSAVLRESVPDIFILNGALDLYAPNTGTQPFPDSPLYHQDADSFMDAMYTAQPTIFTLFDGWNSHSYPIGFRESPYEQSFGFDALNDAVINPAIPADGIYNRGINGYEWELWKLETYDITGLGVYITETGWRFGAGDYPTERIASQYLDVAMRGQASTYATDPLNFVPWLGDERVVAVVPFALNGIPSEWSHSNWLRMNADGQVAGTTLLFDVVSRYFDESSNQP